MMVGVRLSVRLPVACLDLSREREGLDFVYDIIINRSPRLVRWKPITLVTREPI